MRSFYSRYWFRFCTSWLNCDCSRLNSLDIDESASDCARIFDLRSLDSCWCFARSASLSDMRASRLAVVDYRSELTAWMLLRSSSSLSLTISSSWYFFWYSSSVAYLSLIRSWSASSCLLNSWTWSLCFEVMVSIFAVSAFISFFCYWIMLRYSFRCSSFDSSASERRLLICSS